MVESMVSPGTLPAPLADLVGRSRPLPAAELSLLDLGTRLNLRARNDGAIARAGDAFGVALPRDACTFAADESRVAVWLGPDEWFLGADDADAKGLASRIAAAIGDTPHSLVDVTGRSLTIVLSGPMAAEVLAVGCPLDLANETFPVGAGTRTVLGKSEILLCRAGEAEFHVDVWRSYAPYVWAFLEEARREFRA